MVGGERCCAGGASGYRDDRRARQGVHGPGVEGGVCLSVPGFQEREHRVFRVEGPEQEGQGAAVEEDGLEFHGVQPGGFAGGEGFSGGGTGRFACGVRSWRFSGCGGYAGEFRDEGDRGVGEFGRVPWEDDVSRVRLGCGGGRQEGCRGPVSQAICEGREGRRRVAEGDLSSGGCAGRCEGYRRLFAVGGQEREGCEGGLEEVAGQFVGAAERRRCGLRLRGRRGLRVRELSAAGGAGEHGFGVLEPVQPEALYHKGPGVESGYPGADRGRGSGCQGGEVEQRVVSGEAFVFGGEAETDHAGLQDAVVGAAQVRAGYPSDQEGVGFDRERGAGVAVGREGFCGAGGPGGGQEDYRLEARGRVGGYGPGDGACQGDEFCEGGEDPGAGGGFDQPVGIHEPARCSGFIRVAAGAVGAVSLAVAAEPVDVREGEFGEDLDEPVDRALGGRLSCRCEGETLTEPGLRQSIGADMCLVSIDEFEESPERKKILKALRSGGRGGKIRKGSPSQRAQVSQIQHMVFVSSIEKGIQRAAENSRFLIVETKKDKTRRPVLPSIKEAREIREEMVAYALWAGFRAVEMVESVKAVDGIERRFLESLSVSYSMLAAAYEEEDGLESLVKSYLEEYRTRDESQTPEDEERLLQDILMAQMRITQEIVEEFGTRSKMVSTVRTVGQLVFDADLCEEHHLVLQARGIRVMDGELSPGIFVHPETVSNQLLRGTIWHGLNIRDLLIRVEKAESKRLRIAGSSLRGVIVPWGAIDFQG